MEEVAAPDGYNKVSTSFTFTIKNGQVTQTSAVSEEYDVSDNEIVMKGQHQENGFVVSRQSAAVKNSPAQEQTDHQTALTCPRWVMLTATSLRTASQMTQQNISWTSDGTKGQRRTDRSGRHIHPGRDHCSGRLYQKRPRP